MQKQQLCLPLESKERDETTTYYIYRIGSVIVIESITVYHPKKKEDDDD